ncbi:ABC transporter permease [Aeromicrobium sp. CTD01-1L150]|uniref:ABC transporter permease n=1 Tax=Aeromicrobium sp. CTD01-1L150 TaxID=3341830 RepID=UPI0035BED216
MTTTHDTARPSSAPALASAATRRPGGPRFPLWLVRIALIAAFLVAIEFSVRVEIIDPFFVARPSSVLVQMGSLLTDSEFLSLVGITLAETFVAFGLAAVVGVIVGFLLWRFRALGDAFEPLVAALFSSPIVLLYPIFLVILGRNSAAIVALAAVFAVLPTILFTKQALGAVSQTMLNVGRSLRLSAWSNFRYILLPAAAPTIFTGLRIALTYVLIVVVAMEYILQIGGLGRFVSEASLLFRATDLYVSVGLIVVISAGFIWLINRLEKVVQR